MLPTLFDVIFLFQRIHCTHREKIFNAISFYCFKKGISTEQFVPSRDPEEWPEDRQNYSQQVFYFIFLICRFSLHAVTFLRRWFCVSLHQNSKEKMKKNRFKLGK